jgi:hypothetical protein
MHHRRAEQYPALDWLLGLFSLGKSLSTDNMESEGVVTLCPTSG